MLRLFLRILICIVGVPTVCGLLVCFCSFLFRRLCGRGVGYTAVLATSLIGTPIHELGHAGMCLLFAHRIEAIRLWNPHSEDGRLGFVDHSYRSRNPYATIGNFFIGIGPLLSGGAVVLLLLRFAFPAVCAEYSEAVRSATVQEIDLMTFFSRLATMLPLFFGPSSVAWYARVGAMLLILSVSLHVSLSPEDLRGSLRAIPWLLVVAAVTSGVSCFLGETVLVSMSHLVLRIAFCTLALFFAVLAADVVLVALALLIFLVRVLLGGVLHVRG